MKSFKFDDLSRLVDALPYGSRTGDVLSRILKGEAVDLTKYPSAPSKKYGKRHPSTFTCNVKRILRKHDGVLIEGYVVSIPELKPRKSYLRDY